MARLFTSDRVLQTGLVKRAEFAKVGPVEGGDLLVEVIFNDAWNFAVFFFVYRL